MSTISSSSILSKVTLLAMLDRDKVTSIVGQLYRNVFMERVAYVLCMVHGGPQHWEYYLINIVYFMSIPLL